MSSSYETDRLAAWRRATDAPVLLLAIGTIPLLILEVVRPRLTEGDRFFLDVVNVVVFIVFAADYVVELALARNRWAFVRAEWPNLLIVISQALALAPSLAVFGPLRALRGARALRSAAVVFRAVAVGGAAAMRGRRILRRRAAGFALSMAGLTWLTSAVAFTLAEDVGDSRRVSSFFDALWWSSTTITTVGYGDVYPVTTAGRVVGVVTMLVGISTFAVVTAKVAEFLVRTSPADPDS